jgi:hypothetical protein
MRAGPDGRYVVCFPHAMHLSSAATSTDASAALEFEEMGAEQEAAQVEAVVAKQAFYDGGVGRRHSTKKAVVHAFAAARSSSATGTNCTTSSQAAAESSAELVGEHGLGEPSDAFEERVNSLCAELASDDGRLAACESLARLASGSRHDCSAMARLHHLEPKLRAALDASTCKAERQWTLATLAMLACANSASRIAATSVVPTLCSLLREPATSAETLVCVTLHLAVLTRTEQGMSAIATERGALDALEKLAFCMTAAPPGEASLRAECACYARWALHLPTDDSSERRTPQYDHPRSGSRTSRC